MKISQLSDQILKSVIVVIRVQNPFDKKKPKKTQVCLHIQKCVSCNSADQTQELTPYDMFEPWPYVEWPDVAIL